MGTQKNNIKSSLGYILILSTFNYVAYFDFVILELYKCVCGVCVCVYVGDLRDIQNEK